MDNEKRYAYILEKAEVGEFCRHAMWESIKHRKWIWMRLAVILVLELVLLPRVGIWAAGITVVVMMISLIKGVIHIYKTVSGYQWAVWIEGDMLKVVRGSRGSELPCCSVQLVRTTRRLLMLGYLQTAQRPAWFILPLRVFADGRDKDWFLDRLQNPQPSENVGGHAEPVEGGLCFTYTLDAGKWVQFQRDALGVVTSGTLGMMERVRLVLVWGLFTVSAVLICVYLVAGRLVWQSAAYGIGLALLFMLRFFTRDPKKMFRKQIQTPVVRDRECGVWQITMSEAEVCAQLPTGARNHYDWESLGWLVETGDAYYLFYKDRKHYVMIAKESFQDWNQVSAMHALCARKGVKSVRGRRMHYLPDWAFILTIVLFFALCIELLFISIFRSHVQEARDQLERASQEIRSQLEEMSQETYGGLGEKSQETYGDQKEVQQEMSQEMYGGLEDAQQEMRGLLEGAPQEARGGQEEAPLEASGALEEVPQGIYWSDAFDPADYPDYVALDEQVEVLETLGLHVSEDVVASVRESMTVPGMQVMIEGYPYTWLLTHLGAPQYNEDWTAVEKYAQDVFWFDFEGMGLETDYINILNGMLALAQGSCLDTVTDIAEDTTDIDWEKGRGTIVLRLEWNSQVYHWEMTVHNDWLDSDVLGVLNALLAQENDQRRFYVTGDNAQGAIVLFGTTERAEAFQEATGLELESDTTWSVEQQEMSKQ